MSPRREALTSDAGSALVTATIALVVLAMLSILLVDVTALFRATRRAQATADAAALAAADVSNVGVSGSPFTAARAVAEANGAIVLACACLTRPMTVEVEVPLATRLLERIGMTHVRARSTATLVDAGP